MADTTEDGLPLTPRELDAMKALWRRGGEATVYDFLDDLPEDTPYTSALSILQTLDRKGIVEHRRQGRKYVWIAAEDWRECRMDALRYVLEAYYEGESTVLEIDLNQLRRAAAAGAASD